MSDLRDEWDILARAFDDYVAKLNDDGIPEWMIEERLRIEQLHLEKKIDEFGKNNSSFTDSKLNDQ
jgi:hypothetical protein